ncbi:MAG: TolC family protein [Myxococcales bacterium]|nr:MAG: TolC family protein [Myxococcales bacterium]
MRQSRRTAATFAFFALVFTAPWAWSEESAPVIRWPQIEEAVSSHPGFRVSQEDVAVAEGEVGVTKQYPNPDFGVRLGAADPKAGPGREFIWELELTIPVEWPGNYVYRSDAASHGVDAAKHEARTARLEVWRQLRSLYFTIAFDQEKLRLLRETEAELIRLVEAVKLRVDQGEARPVESSRAQSELEEHRIALNTAESEAEAHRQQLSLWLGGKLPDLFVVEVDPESVAKVPSRQEAIQTALARHPTLKAAQARNRQADSSAVAERHAAAPNLGVGGFYGQELDSTSYGGMITIGLPLWNWNLGGIAKADAEKRRGLAQADLAEREIREAVIAVHAKAQAALRAVQRYRDSVLPASEKAFHNMEQLYKTGETGLTDILDARRAHLRTQDAYLAELFNYHFAMLDLSVWMGGPPNA